MHPFGECFVDTPNNLDVLLRHRLLRQPGGFEGVLVADLPRQLALHAIDYESRTGRLGKTDWRLQVLGRDRSARVSEPARAARDRQESRTRMDGDELELAAELEGSGQLVTVGRHQGEGAVADDLSAADHADRIEVAAVLADMGGDPGEIDRDADRRAQRAGDGSRGRALHGPVGTPGFRQRRRRTEGSESEDESAEDDSLELRHLAFLSLGGATNLSAPCSQSKPVDVLLRHRLLGKAGGFEGLLGIEVGPNPNRLAVLHVSDRAEGHLGHRPALLAPRADAADPDDSITQVPDLRVVEVDVVESLINLTQHLTDTVVSPADGRLASEWNQKRRMPLHLGVELLQQRFGVPAVIRLSPALERFDVLLRHRLLRQLGGFEGLVGVEVSPDPNRPAVLVVGYASPGRLGLGATFVTTRTGAADRDESVSQVPDLRELDVGLGESLVQVSEHLADALVSPVHGRFPTH